MILDFRKVHLVFYQTASDLTVYHTDSHTECYWGEWQNNGLTNFSRIGKWLAVQRCFQSWLMHLRGSILALRFCLAWALILSFQCVAAC